MYGNTTTRGREEGSKKALRANDQSLGSRCDGPPGRAVNQRKSHLISVQTAASAASLMVIVWPRAYLRYWIPVAIRSQGIERHQFYDPATSGEKQQRFYEVFGIHTHTFTISHAWLWLTYKLCLCPSRLISCAYPLSSSPLPLSE